MDRLPPASSNDDEDEDEESSLRASRGGIFGLRKNLQQPRKTAKKERRVLANGKSKVRNGSGLEYPRGSRMPRLPAAYSPERARKTAGSDERVHMLLGDSHFALATYGSSVDDDSSQDWRRYLRERNALGKPGDDGGGGSGNGIGHGAK